MSNRLRGDTPFDAACLQKFKVQPYVCYGTREIARIQGALGPRPIDPYAPDTAIEEDVPVIDRVQDPKSGRWSRQQKVENGLPVFERKRVLLNHAQRQQRWLEFVNARFGNPDDEALAICLRHGLERWAREAEAPIVDHMLEAGLFDEVREELGRVRLHALQAQAIAAGTFIEGTRGDDSDTKAASGAAASSTSST